MSALDNLTNEIKEAMKAKNALALEALRAIKSAVLLQKSEAGAADGMTDDQEIKLLQKLVKQRRDSAAIFRKQNRADLAEPEEAQAEIIARFLPEQLSEEEVGKVIESIITQLGASSMKDMGKVMGMACNQLAGKADGKTISTLVKQKLSS
ncbi:GatB/YqeY domain-containing protein [Flavobacteriaceae bacterium]|nr:GatB/YqeY domain-containing protein [Flavobacteriaceae bacterium]